jgi:SAM-dependent methyltransferase
LTSRGDACPSCGNRQFRSLFRATDRLYQTTVKPFLVVECSGCHLIRLYPWPEPEDLKLYYPESYWFAPEPNAAASLEERYRRLVLRDHVSFVLGALQHAAAGPVLDVGCGGALFGRLLRERGVPCLGLDASTQAASVGWRGNGVPVTVGDFEHPPFAEGSFAAVTMFHVVEHLYEPGAYLKSAARCLRPDGRLIVQVPNADCWQFLLLGEAWNGIDVPRHLVNYRTADIDALLEHAGFEVVRHKFFSLRDNPAGLASSLAPALDPMARRIRHPGEGARERLFKDLLYFAIVVAALPFTLLEAACRAGSTVMIEARRKAA